MTKLYSKRACTLSLQIVFGLTGFTTAAAGAEADRAAHFTKADLPEVLSSLRPSADGSLVSDFGPVERLDRSKVELPTEKPVDGAPSLRMQCLEVDTGLYCCMDDNGYMCCVDGGTVYCA
jgi:hypothetical protein